jgi:hypothetical protein
MKETNVKKSTTKHENEDGRRRVLARVLADNLYGVHGSATSTSLNGPAPDVEYPQSGEISEAATSESIPDR